MRSFQRKVSPISQFQQSSSVDDSDDTSFGADETLTFQGLHREGNIWPRHSKHDREKLMGERQCATIDTIIRHEQPAGQAACVLAATIGKHTLRGLNEESVGVPQKGPMEVNALIGCPAQLG
jgi:hypothetical protein